MTNIEVNMITRVAEDTNTIQVLMIDTCTRQFVYDKKSNSINEIYDVTRIGDKTYYNPLSLDQVDIKDLVTVLHKIKTYRASKHE